MKTLLTLIALGAVGFVTGPAWAEDLPAPAASAVTEDLDLEEVVPERDRVAESQLVAEADSRSAESARTNRRQMAQPSGQLNRAPSIVYNAGPRFIGPSPYFGTTPFYGPPSWYGPHSFGAPMLRMPADPYGLWFGPWHSPPFTPYMPYMPYH